jgi:DNA-binding transcriptional LysR family regulator
MKLRDLQYFATLADELHFGRAARKLAIAQPSLSQKIRSFENELGVSLFQRHNRQVALTSAGQSLHPYAKNILSDIGKAKTLVQGAGRGEIGQLRIGFIGLAALDILPPLLAQFRANYPNVIFNLYERSSAEQVKNVLDGELDVGIVREPRAVTSLASMHITRDPLVVALPKSHRFAKKRRIAIRDLKDESFVLFPRNKGTAMYDRIIGACVAADFSPRVVQEANIMTTIIGLVATGVGLSIIPSVASCVRHERVVYLPLTPPLLLDTGMIWDPKVRLLNPALEAFLRLQRAK